MKPTIIANRFNCLCITLAILIPVIASQNICRDMEAMEASFYMIPEFRTEPMNIRKDKEIFMHGNRSCRKARKAAKRKKKPIPLCPVFYVLNYDQNRFPVFVVEAKCACQSCGDNSTNICRPLYYYRDILEYSKERRCYTKSVKQFQNGCHCVKSSRLEPEEPQPPPP